MKKPESFPSHTYFVFLTGAGISKESGLDTFRENGGLWAEHNINDIATPEAFEKKPDLVQKFYNMRRAELAKAFPNDAHKALERLEKTREGKIIIITQNVDNLHERAGSKKVIHMHGSLEKALCTACRARFQATPILGQQSVCPECKSVGAVRPDIVWFGEMPYHLNDILDALSHCLLFVAIGTSSRVHPAASFVQKAPYAYKIEINVEKTPATPFFDEHLCGTASDLVPKLVDDLLSICK